MPERSTEYFINFLSEVPFFSEVDKNSLKLLFREAKEENFLSNEVIFKKNDIGNSMYIIVEGKVKVHEKNHIYSFLSQGDCFGEYALIDSEKRSASITTTEKTKVLRIDRQCFIELMANDNGFAKGILSVMINRHREKNIIQEKLAASINDLELANSKLSGLINGALDSIIMIDSEFKIILTNPSADVLLENDDSLKRNVLFFFDDESADLILSLIQTQEDKFSNKHIPGIIKVIGSNGTESQNEGTISMFGNQEEVFYTLILRNIDGRLENEERINILTNQTRYLKEEIKDLTNDFGIIAEDKNMIQVLNLVEQVAPTNATVLIVGETGTGKELIARAIHSTSDRLNNPLIRVNCGAIPENLIESELFGHEKGAFTGASSSRKGRFAMADKGTIFLDEIGELPLQLQPKLLRVIQEGEFEPVGSSDTIKIDVRIIAATHRDLLGLSKEGEFREDLYYRLNVFPIEVPALRDRGDDVCLIARHMIGQYSKKMNKPLIELTDSDISMINSYNWPGNVRELQNLIERGIIVSKDGSIQWDSIIPNAKTAIQPNEVVSKDIIYTTDDLVEIERENIIKALKKTNWRISGKNGAATLLKMPSTTLASKLKSLGIKRPV